MRANRGQRFFKSLILGLDEQRNFIHSFRSAPTELIPREILSFCRYPTFWMKMLSPVCAAALFLCIVATSFDSSWCYPSSSSPVNLRSKRSIDNENPEDIVRILMKLAQDVIDSDSLMHTSDKRGIDLGLSRGFSGSQAAKHLMGLAAANFANGPGRRRRDLESQ
ncbi:hypothetical protein CDAR_407551 [Caerostris darwini]|uniref:Diuretic hormone class 2 n=1 Tax=Caerostris darwini TaxID=1538125 RepID=A0AAV4Q6E0_9ARAC|nr:hypothetical protein CDAR_407551 [Caerostris darwini]